MSGKFFPGQKVLVEKGKSTWSAQAYIRTLKNRLNVNQKYLVPGLIDAHSHLGLFESCSPMNDMVES